MTRPGDFAPQADAYARARPGYPAELLDRLVEVAGVAPGDPVADVGAGTGIFTADLAARGFAVTAIEPSAAMRAKAPSLAGVVWRDGTWEATGLATASQRWLVGAQAFHWADPPRALPEAYRILRQGSFLTVLWNNRDLASSELLRFTAATIQQVAPGFDEGYRDRDWSAVLPSSGHFEPPIELAVPHVVTMTGRRFLDLWRSHNLLSHAAGEAGLARILAVLAERLDDDENVPVPYVCRAWSARRLG